MPVYEWACECGARFEKVLPYAQSGAPQRCACGKEARRVLSAPMLRVRQDIRYRSPIDGRPITSMRARREDLARNDCIEYDPEMKTDCLRRVAEDERNLDRSVEATLDAQIEAMPARKREQLETELKAGAGCEMVRQTYGDG